MRPIGQRLHDFGIAHIQTLAQGCEPDRAIHRAGIDVWKIELASNELAGSGLSDAGRTIDRDDERLRHYRVRAAVERDFDCVRRAGAFLLPVFFDDAAFLRDGARRAGRRGAASCIVASIFTSLVVSSRHTPGVSFGSEIGPIATRRSFETG